MFKSLLFFKTYIIKFTNKVIKIYKIRKQPFFVSIDKNEVINPTKKRPDMYACQAD